MPYSGVHAYSANTQLSCSLKLPLDERRYVENGSAASVETERTAHSSFSLAPEPSLRCTYAIGVPGAAAAAVVGAPYVAP